VHEVGALLAVDGVHLTAHVPVDLPALGADLYVCSPYKFLGPHCGVLAAAPSLLEQLRPAKLLPSTDAVPERFELGTLPYELLAGTTAAVDFLAGLDATATGSRRERILASMAAVEAHERALLRRLLDGMAGMPHVRRIGSPSRQAPTVWFRVGGFAPAEVAEHCARARINVWSGHNYAWELAGLLGIRDSGSAVRAGMSCYTDASDVDRLLEALDDLRR
jgi:selenocysteine lyase/cysteine desulfurase